MNNDFKGFVDALSSLDKRVEKLVNPWDEINRLMDCEINKLNRLKNALGIEQKEK
jgi:hypothetical protein